jgi:hypothetical protein
MDGEHKKRMKNASIDSAIDPVWRRASPTSTPVSSWAKALPEHALFISFRKNIITFCASLKPRRLIELVRMRA